MNQIAMHNPNDSYPCTGEEVNSFRIVVNSIGTAGAGLVGVLKKVLPLADARLAAMLYQAPAEIVGGLPREQAEQINELLRSTGLDSKVLEASETFVPGIGEYEVALAVKDLQKMTLVARAVMDVLGVGLDQAKQLLCNSPTVLLGNVSSNTVQALRDRFAALGVDVDVSRPDEARYDVFLGECGPSDRQRVLQILHGLKIKGMTPHDLGGNAQPLLAVGITKGEANKLWDQLRRTAVPLRLVNRDFERFDVRLDEATQSPALVEYLVEKIKMPAKIVPKALSRLPIILQQNVTFAQMTEVLASIAELGGKASGHLLAFQTYGIALGKLGNATTTAQLLQALGGLPQDQALSAMQGERPIMGVMTHPQIRWLQHELKKAGTESRVVTR